VFLYHSAASGPIQGVKKAQLEILVKGVIKDRRAAASHEIPQLTPSSRPQYGVR
jgi:hypothetical protein